MCLGSWDKHRGNGMYSSKYRVSGGKREGRLVGTYLISEDQSLVFLTYRRQGISLQVITKALGRDDVLHILT